MHLYRCRLSGTMGCEQLLLDTHSLKTVLLDLPNLVSSESKKIPGSYTKIVVKGMTRAEMILKLANFPIDPAPTFVENYIRLLPDSDAVEFQKLLEMKCLKRTDQPQLIELFRQKHKHPASQTVDTPPVKKPEQEVPNSAPAATIQPSEISTPVSGDGQHRNTTETSQSLNKLEKLIKNH